jgi:cell wall-associated NlpC family hydrolase
MKRALRLLLGLSLLMMAMLPTALRVAAQTHGASSSRQTKRDTAQLPQLPRINFDQFNELVLPRLRPTLLPVPLFFTNDTAALVYNAISQKLGVRYRFFGTDERGYDCSGFVWRVFQDAGGSFDRVAARTLWQQLPEATGEEVKQFGTLVFFNGVKHVGIVRDAYSFYHASRSHGVTLSSLSGYWGTRITGYRRAPLPLARELFPFSE